jgi:hypothetical protein
MGRLTALILLLGCLAAATPALSAQGDISGTWDLTVETAEGASKIQAMIQLKGEAVVGQIDTAVGLVDFSGTFVDGALDVRYTMDVRGRSVDVNLYGTVKDDTMTGALYRSDIAEQPFTAKKKPA